MKKSILLLILLLPSLLHARNVEGIDFPEVLAAESENLKLQGVAVRKKLFVDVYAAGFYSSDSISSAQDALDSKAPKEMRMVFIYNNIKPGKFVSGWKESIAKNNSKSQIRANAKNLDKFYKLFNQPLSSSDEIVIRKTSTGATEVSMNKNLVLTVEDKSFYNMLLSTWMGERPPSTGFQKSLLSK